MAVGFEDNWVHDRLGLAELVARMDVDPTEPVEAVIARAEIVQSAINVIALHSFDQASSSWSALLR